MPTPNKCQTCIYGCSSSSNLRYFYKYLGKRIMPSIFNYHKKYFINILYPPLFAFLRISPYICAREDGKRDKFFKNYETPPVTKPLLNRQIS